LKDEERFSVSVTLAISKVIASSTANPMPNILAHPWSFFMDGGF
jgi:hypothetical protein